MPSVLKHCADVVAFLEDRFRLGVKGWGEAMRRHGGCRAIRAGVALWVACCSGCATGQYVRAARRVRANNPHAAIEYIALAQQRNPEHGGAHDVLIDILQNIPYDHEDTLRRLEAAGEYDLAVAECDRMTATAHLVGTLPGARYQVFHRPEQRNALAEKAAALWYERARAHEDGGRMRDAVLAYDRCLGFRPEFKDAAVRRESARASAMVRLWIRCVDAYRHPDVAERLTRGTGVEAMKSRPRFMALAREASQADSVATLTIEQADVHDTGWRGREDSRSVFSEWRDPETGRVTRVRHRAVWVVYTRHIRYALSVRLSVDSEHPDHPRPAETFADSLEARGTYATWSGSRRAVPAHILYLSRRPVPPMDETPLRDRLLDEAIVRFGHALFLAYK